MAWCRICGHQTEFELTPCEIKFLIRIFHNENFTGQHACKKCKGKLKRKRNQYKNVTRVVPKSIISIYSDWDYTNNIPQQTNGLPSKTPLWGRNRFGKFTSSTARQNFKIVESGDSGTPGVQSQIDIKESIVEENMTIVNKRDLTELTINCQGSTAPVTRSQPNSPTKNNIESPQSGSSIPHKFQALNGERLCPGSQSSKKATYLSTSKRQIKCDRLALKTTHAASLTTNTTTITKSSRITNNSTKTSSATSKNNLINGQMKPILRKLQVNPRRSDRTRTPKTKLLEERQKTIEEYILNQKQDGLCIEDFGVKGRGIVTTQSFDEGEFVIEYIGELIDLKEAKNRESQYAMDASIGCYMYYFHFNDHPYCIDATEESPFLGRLVNHSCKGNLLRKTVEVDGRPHIIFIAKTKIEENTEVMYDYGDRKKESLEHHPWLAK